LTVIQDWNELRIQVKKTRDKKQLTKPAAKPANQSPGRSEAKADLEVRSGTTPSTTRSLLQRSEFWVVIGLIAVNVFIYAPVSRYGAVSYDDASYISENTHLSDVTWQNIQWAFTTNQAGFWMPVTWLSHMLDAWFFGSATGPQHVINVVFHIANSVLLFGILCRLTTEWKPSAIVAALFAVHPLHVESVAWMAERKDVLSTFFWMLALWTYVAYARRPDRTRYLLLLILFALGLMSKPTLVTLPFVLLLLDIWPLRRLRIERGPQKIWLRLILEKLPLLIMAIAVSAVTVVMSLDKGNISSSETFPLTLRLSNASVAYVAYIRDIFWPANLSVFYPFRSIAAWEVLGSLLLLTAVSVFTSWNARRHPYLLVGWLWYVGTLVPVIGLVQAGAQSRADRYTYIPVVGLFIAGAWGLSYLTDRWRYRRIVLSSVAAVLLCSCTLEARQQVLYWENGRTLWQHALDTTKENFVAHTILGYVLAKEGKTDEAIAHYEKAIGIRPEFAMAHNNLGIALARQRRADEAIDEFETALRLSNNTADIHYNLGFELAEQNRLDEAIVQYNIALDLEPDYAPAFSKRGDAHLRQGRINEAIADYTRALALRPRFVEALNNLGMALVNQGKYDEGIARYRDALRIQADFADAHNNLGVALANQGKYDEAIDHFSEALRIRPDYSSARENLRLAREIRNRQ
jgi:tetratricopeptide (TPR) repeat protein